ncbi:hypothetical protein Zm00014a_024491 [Zea mays]|jgi:hypothetical protein|uniref:Uncharacterized protein n=1 Tax=Zea mays TaxID=4577 RepID=A0A3L6GF09_MAIZE|nr:hypothetical protein Zm00014a_024491 [Zea mays]
MGAAQEAGKFHGEETQGMNAGELAMGVTPSRASVGAQQDQIRAEGGELRGREAGMELDHGERTELGELEAGERARREREGAAMAELGARRPWKTRRRSTAREMGRGLGRSCARLGTRLGGRAAERHGEGFGEEGAPTFELGRNVHAREPSERRR